ncbi:hypothetical protein HPULCUR_002214 [Helicostylum pulchrum]|uniref:Uncharacterized protein n=1 Tax=Helicostylum pulchrum TaxID=562976 RepID=A0ABP9XPW3_9FUNG
MNDNQQGCIRIITEKNDERYPWLQEQKDLQGNAIGSPGYDSHTLFFPVNAWTKFIPFGRQYWEFKQKCMNKIVFFQKDDGKGQYAYGRCA